MTFRTIANHKNACLCLCALLLAMFSGCTSGKPAGSMDAGTGISAVADTVRGDSAGEDAGTDLKGADDYTLGSGGHRLKTFFSPSAPAGGGSGNGLRLRVGPGGGR